MAKLEIEYEISLVKSNKWNDVVKVLIKTINWQKEYFWMKAIHKVCQNKYLFTKEDKSFVKSLKKMTDKNYLENNK